MSIKSLQKHQNKHDENYHADISSRSTQDRMKHLTFHFAKYVGDVIALNPDWYKEIQIDKSKFEKILVDTFIIALSAANTLNMNLEVIFANEITKYPTFNDTFQLSSGYIQSTFNDRWYFATRLGMYTGKMAKQCEALDHLENGNYRDNLVAEVQNILLLVAHTAFAYKIDLISKYALRILEVEAKSIL